MDWKQQLNTTGIIIDSEIDDYLKKNGFEESTFKPRFYNEESYCSEIKNFDAPCLTLYTDDPKDRTNSLKLMINRKEAYLEVSTDYRSLDRSYHITIEEELTINLVDDILNELTNY
jgi:hypothetical protein